MNRIFYTFCLAMAVLATTCGCLFAQLLVSEASAQGFNPLPELQTTYGGATLTNQSAAAPKDLRIVVANVVRVALSFVAMILTVLVLYAGFLWFSARGNGEQVEKGKKILRNAMIGLVLILMAYSFTTFLSRLITNPQSVSTVPPPTATSPSTRFTGPGGEQPVYNGPSASQGLTNVGNSVGNLLP